MLLIKTSIVLINLAFFFAVIAHFSNQKFIAIIKSGEPRINVGFYLGLGYLSSLVYSDSEIIFGILIESSILIISAAYAAYLVKN